MSFLDTANEANFNAPLVLQNPTIPIGTIGFGDFIITNSNVCISSIDFHNPPTRDITSFDIPRAHGKRITSDFYREKDLTINGVIKACKWCDVDEIVDNMLKNLTKQNGELFYYFCEDEGRRIYTATFTAGGSTFPQRENFHIGFLPFRLRFKTYEPFSRLSDEDFKTQFNQIQTSFPYQIDNFGDVEAPADFAIIFSKAVNIDRIRVTDANSGRVMTIEQSVRTGDILEILGSKSEVRYNGDPQGVDFLGRFFDLQVGSNSFVFEFLGVDNSVRFDITGKNQRRLLR